MSQARVRETLGSTAADVLFELLLRTTLPAVEQRSSLRGATENNKRNTVAFHNVSVILCHQMWRKCDMPQ